MTFQEAFTANAKFKSFKAFVNSPDSPRRRKKMKRLERAVRNIYGFGPNEKIDWSKIDWAEIFRKWGPLLLSIILMLI